MLMRTTTIAMVIMMLITQDENDGYNDISNHDNRNDNYNHISDHKWI